MISSFWLFWTFFGQRMASYSCRVDFLHKRIVHNKFQLKIPTLSENDCSATWKPNTFQKYDTCGKVRNVQRYQKYVVLLRSFIFIVSDIFKPTVNEYFDSAAKFVGAGQDPCNQPNMYREHYSLFFTQMEHHKSWKWNQRP